MEEAATQEEKAKELPNTESLQEQEKPPENRQSTEAQETGGQSTQSEPTKRNIPSTNQQEFNHMEPTRDMKSEISSHNIPMTMGSIQDNPNSKAKQGTAVTQEADHQTVDKSQQGLDSEARSNREQKEETTGSTEDRAHQATQETTQPIEISPKEWQKHHDNWLNVVMRNSIGETKPPVIPDFHAYIPVFRPGPDLDIDVALIKTYVTRYNLQIKVDARENQVKLFHQAFCKWFLKLREANNQVIIYPWAERVRDEEGLFIENPTDIPMALPFLKKFMHKLFLRMTGGAYHVQVLLRTKQDLETIMETIGWWLKSTEQGMWRTNLQTAEESMYASWLLFSADKYNREALSQEIWNVAGVHVTLHY